jgi:hypothetical protein
MLIKEVLQTEASPDTVKGSFTRDLVTSKLWLINELGKIKSEFDNIYILGSWYGNMSILLLAPSQTAVKFRKAINVDRDQSRIDQGQELAKKLGVDDKIETMVKDVNDLDFRQVTDLSAVINTSVNDMDSMTWFDNIPAGTVVALQSRESLENFEFTKKLYSGEKDLEDPETKYTRYMVIGIK